jgi:hypothetical protein
MPSDTSLIFDVLARDRASAEFDKVAGSALAAGSAVERAFDGKKIGDGLERKLTDARMKVRELSAEFEKTGDVEILGKIKDERSKINTIRGAMRDLKTDIEKVGNASEKAAKQSIQLGDAFENGIMGLLKTPGGMAAAALIGGTLAIPLGAAAGGAVTGGIGAGVAGAGIAGALKGPDKAKIESAWGAVIADVEQRWIAGSRVFSGPLVAAAQTFHHAMDDIHIEAILNKASAFIAPLAAGAARFASYLGQGLGTVVDKAGPVIAVIGDELPRLGRAIATAMSDISSGSEGGAEALRDVFVVIEGTIVGVGRLIMMLENAYAAIKSFGDGWKSAVSYLRDTNGLLFVILEPMDALIHLFNPDKPIEFAHALHESATGVRDLGQETAASSAQLQGFISALSNSKTTVDDVAAAITDKLISSMLALDNANLGFEKSLTGVADAFAQNGRAMDIHTSKGQANREAILGSVGALQRQYDENVKAGMSAVDAALAYDQGTAALERQLKKAGLTTAQINDLIGKYKGVPGKVDTDIQAHGLEGVLADLDDTLRTINNLPKRTDLYIYEHHSGIVGGKEGPSKYASGTMSARGGLALVGELGPELVELPAGARVYTANETRAIAASRGGSPSSGGSVEIIFGSDGSSLGDAILAIVQNAVRLQGGNAAALGIRN